MNRRALLVILSGAMALTRLALGSESKGKEFAWEGPCMGSHFRVLGELPVQISPDESKQLEKQVRARLEALELIFSVHRPDSEVLELCQKANASPRVEFIVSKELFEVTKNAQALSKETLGYFDLTVGSLTNYWRYCRANQILPEPDRVKELKQRVGWEQLQVQNGKIAFHPKAKRILLDYGGIAKGYAADEVAKILRLAEISQALVDVGGEVLAMGAKTGQTGWDVKLLNETGEQTKQEVLLVNAALSTSGDLYQSIHVKDEHRSHVVSRKEPAGLETLSAVIVKTESAWRADALSTAAHAAWGTEDFPKILALIGESWVYPEALQFFIHPNCK